MALRLSAALSGEPLGITEDLDRVAGSLRQLRLVSEVSRTDATWSATLRLIEGYLSRLRHIVDPASSEQ